jgi:methylisocitrate lyase
MLFATKSPADKRADFRAALKSGKLQFFMGAHSPLVALEVERHGFEGVYISGAAMSAELGLPDIGLTTLSEVAMRGRQISRVVSLPTIIDIDTGFGETMNAVRTIQDMEEAGLTGCHMEDQENPKRCGHLDNKVIVATAEMVRKVQAASKGKRDANFTLFARTDSRASEGLDAAIERSKAYVDAGADAIFPEALQNESEFEAFRAAIDVPLLANVTEFGKTPMLSAGQLENLGFNVMILPATPMRLALKAIRQGLATIRRDGTQTGVLDDLLTRQELYDIIRYEDYNEFDQNLYNFKL